MKYENNIFSKELAEEIFETNGSTATFETVHNLSNSPPAMISLGEKVLGNYLHSFNGEIFKGEANTSPPKPFFPLLKPQADKVDLLVKFCTKYKTNLDKTTMETEELVVSKVSNQVEDVSTSKPASGPFSNSCMQVIGLFMTVLGAAAVAIAFVSLNATTFGLVGLLVAGIGAVSVVSGVTFFAKGTYRKCQSPPVVRDEEDYFDSFSEDPGCSS